MNAFFNDTASQLEHALRAILPVMGRNDVEQILDLLDCFSVEVVKEPEPGLIMAQARDCFDTAFYLGEILVTAAEVECSGIVAQATIMGHEPRKAILAATVSAIVQSPQASAFTELKPLLEIYVQKYSRLRIEESRLTAATRVNFESMVGEK